MPQHFHFDLGAVLEFTVFLRAVSIVFSRLQSLLMLHRHHVRIRWPSRRSGWHPRFILESSLVRISAPNFFRDKSVAVWCIRRRCLLNEGDINPLNPELNPICYLLTLLGAQHFLHVSRIRVKLLTFRLLMSYIYIYGAPILDVSGSHTTTQHSR